MRGQVRYKIRFHRRKICKVLKPCYNMLITKELLYTWIRILLTLIVVPKNVFSRPKYPWYLINPVHEPICKEKHCKVRSTQIMSYLDPTVDPCSNFYQYVCGGWQQKHPVPPSQTMWSIEIELDHQIALKMRRKLEEPTSSKDSVNAKKFKRFWQTCSILPNLGKLSLEEVRDIVKIAGPWPMLMTEKEKKSTSWNWPDIHYYYFKMSGDGGLFDISLNVDTHDYYKPILELRALHSPFGLIMRDVAWKPEWINHYYHFTANLILKVVIDKYSKITEKFLVPSLKNVYIFRRRLEEAITDEVLDKDAYHALTLNEFQHWFESKLSKQNREKINWVKTLNSLFLSLTDGLMTTNTRINVKHKKFFQKLATILNDTPTEIIVNHLHLYFVERFLLLDKNFQCAMHKLVTVHGMNIGSIRQLDLRWEKCITKYNMKHMEDEMLIPSKLTGNVEKDIYGMFDEIKSIIKMHISNSSWLDEEHKRKAVNRIDDVKLKIGYPNCTLNEKIYRQLVDPNSAHAFYYVNSNLIFISENYLQSPLYTEKLPYVVNYGSIGSLLGHELYHIFDKIAVNYPIYPKETCQTLWPPEILRIYEEKAKCIIDQYNRPIQQTLSCSLSPRNDGKRTYNENFADIMSIRTSYDAFKKRMLDESRTCTILPNLKNINCEKLFFISYAMTFCANIPDWKIVRIAHNNRHSPPELRVNIPIANMPEFSQAFQCNKTSYENSIRRCYFWD